MDIIVDEHRKSIAFDSFTRVSDIHIYARNAGNKELATYTKNKIPGNQTPIRFVFDPKDFPVIDDPKIFTEHSIPSHVTLYYLKIELTYTIFNPENFAPVSYS